MSGDMVLYVSMSIIALSFIKFFFGIPLIPLKFSHYLASRFKHEAKYEYVCSNCNSASTSPFHLVRLNNDEQKSNIVCHTCWLKLHGKI